LRFAKYAHKSLSPTAAASSVPTDKMPIKPKIIHSRIWTPLLSVARKNIVVTRLSRTPT
jgi:hypothetical protein